MRKMIKASQVRSVEFENHPNVEVPNKKMKLSASEDTTKDSIVEVRKKEDEDCHWSSPKDSKRLDKIRKDGIPKATVKQAQWALSIWRDWAQYRKKKLVEQSECKQDLNEYFPLGTVQSIAFWLPKFVAEVRKGNGQPYPPNCLYQISCGLHIYNATFVNIIILLYSIHVL